MSDLHTRPLMGRDMPETPSPPMRERAWVFHGPLGWYWAHSCAPKWTAMSGFPFLDHSCALEGALKHLKECCK